MHSEEKESWEFNTGRLEGKRSKDREMVSKPLNKFVWIDSRRETKKGQKIRRATEDGELWGTMITFLLKGIGFLKMFIPKNMNKSKKNKHIFMFLILHSSVKCHTG